MKTIAIDEEAIKGLITKKDIIGDLYAILLMVSGMEKNQFVGGGRLEELKSVAPYQIAKKIMQLQTEIETKVLLGDTEIKANK